MAQFTDRQKRLFTARECPYCGGIPELVDASEVFGSKGASHPGRYYLCRPCRAWVGCHKFSDEAMGRLAGAELRALRNKAHKVFDLVWKDGHKASRYKAYSWLSLRLGIPRHLVHMGYFDEDDCRRVIALCAAFLYRKDARRYAALQSLVPENPDDSGQDVDACHIEHDQC